MHFQDNCGFGKGNAGPGSEPTLVCMEGIQRGSLVKGEAIYICPSAPGYVLDLPMCVAVEECLISNPHLY